MLSKGKKNIGKNIKELVADNQKKGKAMGANGVKRQPRQILAIALQLANGKSKKRKK